MLKPLRVLIVEDSEEDSQLLVHALRRGGYDVSYERVETAEAMRGALAKQAWDVVVSDDTMSQFDALGALRLMRECSIDTACIIVSGTIGEDSAVEALKAGASDFLVKGRLARLVPAIERSLREHAVREERRAAVARVQQSERRLSAIFNQIAVGIVQTDLAGRLLSANQRFCDILMLPLEQVVGRRLQDFSHPEDSPALWKVFERIAAGERSFVLEQRYLCIDGSQVWINNTVTGVTDDDSRPMSAVAVMEDISARKRAEDDLKLAIHARDEFLSIASHELKTPITSLLLQLRASLKLLEGRSDPEVARDKLLLQLNKALRQIDRMVALIDNLLNVTRFTSGQWTLSRRQADLSELVQGVIGRFQEIVRRSKSEVAVVADRPIVGYWDPVILETVVTNLVSNAVKFGNGKPIEITVDGEGDFARLKVADHGMGIEPDAHNRIFQRFERAVPSRHFGGFGLGLWIARQGIEAHGGTIQVLSSKGAGSVFLVNLPRSSQKADKH